MKTLTNFFKPALITFFVAALLTACKSLPLEEQILEGLNEPGTYTFKLVGPDATKQYLRIYDNPNKVGYLLFEYWQKHPCNQGFQKVIKTTAPGFVQYENEASLRSVDCNTKIAYVFRVDANGAPYEGWVQSIDDAKKKDLLGVWMSSKVYDIKKIEPKYKLVIP